MKLKVYIVFLLLISLFTLTGCSQINGIDQFFFIISIGIDETDEDMLRLSIQVSSDSSSTSGSEGTSGSSQSSSTKIYSVEANTIEEGISILNNFLNKQVNFSHCSALVISEKVAQKGIKSYFNTLNNNTELRETCNLIISSSTAYDLMNNISNSGESFSSRLFDYLTNTEEYTGYTNKSTIGTFLKEFNSSFCEATAVYALVSEDTVQSDGIAVFKDDCMVGHIDPLNSIAHLILKNELNEAIITIDSPFAEDEKVDIKINLYKKTDITTELINGTPFTVINVYPQGSIRSSGENFNFLDSNNIKLVEDEANNYITMLLKDYLYNITRNFNSDIACLGGLYKSHFLTEEKFNKIEWKKIFQDSFFEVNTKSEINSSNLYNKE